MESFQRRGSHWCFLEPQPVESKETWQPEIPLGAQGRSVEADAFDVLTYQKCHIATASVVSHRL